MFLPPSRGPVTGSLFAALRRNDGSLLPAPPAPDAFADPLVDEDLQLALWVCYELHYRGFEAVAESWEWDPQVISLRRALEANLLQALRRDVVVGGRAATVPHRLREIVDEDDGPSVSKLLQHNGDRRQFQELAIHRSIYQLKEADPYTWVIPRLSGRVKAAMVEIQTDEYGGGNVDHMHSELFRKVLRGLGLDDGYSAYVASVPAITLAISNVMSLFGLRRDLRGALVGHFAAYEMTSSIPCRRYARGLRRLGADDDMCEFYDAHVVADALHEQLAIHDLCGILASTEPHLADDILFGAAACLHVEERFGQHLLSKWADGESSLTSEQIAEASDLVLAYRSIIFSHEPASRPGR
ncbi:MAG: hypothetical protein JWM76_2689 [Pseudonocardiales bacterium]|nr:hypothetical protein [Pseudonocardiales bacterium]